MEPSLVDEGDSRLSQKQLLVINHIRNKQRLVIWDDQSTCYSWDKPRIKLRGIRDLLKNRFFPRASRPDKVRTPRVFLAKSGKWVKGQKGGAMIHQQLEDFMESAKQGHLMKDLDPRTNAVVKEALARGWTILDAEFCVGDKDLRLGTGVDLLCITPGGKIATIELKVGYDSVVYQGPTKKRMHKPYTMMDDSPYSQHQLQLLTTKYLFEKMTGLQVDVAEVWVVGHPQGFNEKCLFRCFPIHPDLVSTGETLATLLANPPPRMSKKKKAIKFVTTQKRKETTQKKKTTTTTSKKQKVR
jgi:hypothetical protein